MSLQPVGEVDVVEVGGDDGDAVAVLTGGMALDGDLRVAGGRQLEREAHIAAGSDEVAADDDDLRMAVGSQHVVEEGVTAMKGVAEDKDAGGTMNGLRRAVPCRDITACDDGLQLQRRHERGDGHGEAVALQAQLTGKTVGEEGGKVERQEVVDLQVVLVLHVHIVSKIAVEIDRRGRGGSGQGGMVEGDDLHLLPATQLAVHGDGACLTAGGHGLLLMDEVGPKGPRYVEVGLDEALAVGEETVEIAGQELADIEQVAVDMTEDGVLGVVQARLEDVADDVLKGLGVVDAGEVDDGLVGGGLARHLTDELLGLGIEGGAGLHLGDLAEETDDEPAHLALPFIKMVVLLQFSCDTGANGLSFAVKVVRQAFNGVVHELGIAETQPFEQFAQRRVHRLALVGLQPFGNLRHQAARIGKASRGIHTRAEDNHHACGSLLVKWDRRAIVIVLYGLGGSGIHLRVAAVDVDVRFRHYDAACVGILGYLDIYPWILCRLLLDTWAFIL